MLSRRNLLFGLGAASLLSAVRAAQASEPLAFSELYEREAVLSPKIGALGGREVEMVGFMAPPLKAEAYFFVLTSVPLSVCPFCETEAQWPDDIVLVLTDEPISAVPFNRPIRVRGVLDTGFEKDADTGFVSLIRLVDATFERL
jgi:hypothetical protein